MATLVNAGAAAPPVQATPVPASSKGLRAGALGLVSSVVIAVSSTAPAFACVWFFRHSLLRSARDLVTKGVLPLAGGLSLLGAFVLSVKSYWPAASSYSSFHGVGGIFLIGAGSLVVGVVAMIVTARFQRSYFKHGIRDDG